MSGKGTVVQSLDRLHLHELSSRVFFLHWSQTVIDDACDDVTRRALRSKFDLVKAIERLIELDEQETMRHRERSAFLALTAAILESLPDALIVADADGKIVMVNQMAELMFGYVRTELIGQPVEMLVPGRLRASHEQLRQKYTRYNINPHVHTMGLGSQLRGVRKEGSEFQTDVMLARMVVPRGIYNLAVVRYSRAAEVDPTVLAASVPNSEMLAPNA